MSEKRHPLESFVGRMMNHQAELMTWRGELPSHLAPKYAAASEDERAWSNMSWVQRQCFDIELRKLSRSVSMGQALHSTRLQPCHAGITSPILRRYNLFDTVLFLFDGQECLSGCSTGNNSALKQGTGRWPWCSALVVLLPPSPGGHIVDIRVWSRKRSGGKKQLRRSLDQECGHFQKHAAWVLQKRHGFG